jgi:hypothetical protein
MVNDAQAQAQAQPQAAAFSSIPETHGEPLAVPTAGVGTSPTTFGGDFFRDAFLDASGRLDEGTAIGDPYVAFENFNGRQLEQDSCAPNSVAHLTEILTGRDIDPQDVISQAQGMGLYHAMPGDQGMQLTDIGRLLEAQGIPATVHSGMVAQQGVVAPPFKGETLEINQGGPNTSDQITQELAQGNPIILAVNADVLSDKSWTPEGAIGFRGIDLPDHAITVKALEVNDGRLDAVFADSGRYFETPRDVAGPNVAAIRLPLEQLMDACDGGGCAYIAPQFPNTFEPSKNLELPAELRESDFGAGGVSAGQAEPAHEIGEVEPATNGFFAGFRDVVLGQTSAASEQAGEQTPPPQAEGPALGGFMSAAKDLVWGESEMAQQAVSPPPTEFQQQSGPQQVAIETRQDDWFSASSAERDLPTPSEPSTSWTSWTSESDHQDHAPAAAQRPVEVLEQNYGSPDHGSDGHAGSESNSGVSSESGVGGGSDS